MITQSKDWRGLEKAMEPYSKEWFGFKPKKLVKNGLLLTDGEDNYSLFEDRRGAYYGHYLFGSARGKKALTLSKDMLLFLFSNFPDITEIRGQTPLKNKSALRLNEALGFKPVGVIESVNGPHLEVVLTPEGLKL